jgi:phosphoribosylformylglycinamidine cyclo-ligase
VAQGDRGAPSSPDARKGEIGYDPGPRRDCLPIAAARCRHAAGDRPATPVPPSAVRLCFAMAATYKDAGVDLDVYAQSMGRLPALMHRTFSPRVIRSDGGFAGLFRLDFDSPLFRRHYQDPVLVSGTDGVGTKLKIAQQTDRHDSVGIDLVAMCVNDLLCTGAEPLFFLDYVAMGRDCPDRLEQIVRGISDGCVQADSALLGGETAIMPDMYGPDDYDLAGFAVGVVERSKLIDGRAIAAGDVLLGLHSSGLHSNGFSLVRKILSDAGLDYAAALETLGEAPLGELLLEPTRIYARAIRAVQTHYRVKQVLHGIAHITGGGLAENLSRIMPEGLQPRIDWDAWQPPEIFSWLQATGQVAPEEMARVFNLGIGMVLVVNDYFAGKIAELVTTAGYQCSKIGQIETR